MRLGFTPKLRLAPLWPALAAVLTASALLWVLLPSLFERSAALQLLETLDVLAPVVLGRAAAAPAGAAADLTRPGGAAPAAGAGLQAWVRQLGGAGPLRLTVIAGDGRVLADSARPAGAVAAMQNHAGRPEVRQALATGRGTAVRRSGTTGRKYVYAARTLSGHGGRLFVVRLAQPLSELTALRGRLATAMALAAAAALAAGFFLSLWIDRRLFQPLRRLIAGAGELASGRYGYRLEVPDEDELAALALAINRLAATVEGQLATLSHERDHLQAILAGMSEGVLVVGPDGRAVLANPAFRRLFGLAPEGAGEVAGKPVLEIVRLPEMARVVDETLRRGEGRQAEVEIQVPERRSLQLASAALSGGGGAGVAGAVVVARDTTELLRLIEIRRDFVANVSHELKTPLAAIRGYAETLRDGALGEPETAVRFTDRILRQCRRLQALLEDLLTLSRLESLEMPVQREPVDLHAMTGRAIDLMSSAAAERQVELSFAESPPVRMAGDPDGLERLIVNLLDNGIKYNRPGGEVRVRLSGGEAGDGEAAEVTIEVADTGIGIPQEAIPRIFERFYRVDKGRSREEGGTGLGLAIVKHVAQAHGGQVEVESRLGRGSTFRVRLPVVEVEDSMDPLVPERVRR